MQQKLLIAAWLSTYRTAAVRKIYATDPITGSIYAVYVHASDVYLGRWTSNTDASVNVRSGAGYAPLEIWN